MRDTNADRPVSLLFSRRPAVRRRLEKLLGAGGHRLVSCSLVRQVQAAARDQAFQLAYVDWPAKSAAAPTACSILRAAPCNQTMQIVALTEEGDDSLVAAVLAGGADDFLRLSASDDVLALRIATLKRRAQALSLLVANQASMRESETRHALAAGGSSDGLWEWDLTSNTAFFSPSWKAMLGFKDDEVSDDPREWLDRVHQEDAARLHESLDAHLAGTTTVLACEHRVKPASGDYRWVLARGLAIRDEAGRASRIAGFLTDIATWKEVEERLLHNAFHDSLTGLPNRALFIDRLGHAITRGARHKEPSFAVLFLDVDRFKLVNDSLGHRAGDQLLIELSQRLRSILRHSDTIARFGGDEFAILLEEIEDIREATLIAQRIKSDLQVPFDLEGHDFFVTVSIGIAPGEKRYATSEELLRDADNAMYRAKAAGRDCYAVFNPEMHQRSVDLLQLESDLRHAIERDELFVQYQPIVALRTGRPSGLEALVRWNHPRRGILQPTEFILAAEELGLIIPIDRWVLAQACRQARIWLKQFRFHPPLTVSVNMSGLQLARPDLIMEIDRTLRANGLYGQSLKLEITESVMVEKGRYAPEILEQLRLLNIALTIDDFGTGYSSLSYLRRFAVDALKVDTSFVARMLENDESKEIVDAIVSLAFCLRKDIVAEGVETQEQLDYLRELGCTHAQGFFLAPPLDPDSATELLASNPRW